MQAHVHITSHMLWTMTGGNHGDQTGTRRRNAQNCPFCAHTLITPPSDLRFSLTGKLPHPDWERDRLKAEGEEEINLESHLPQIKTLVSGFLDGPVVKTPCFHCRGNRFKSLVMEIGNKIPPVTQRNQNKDVSQLLKDERNETKTQMLTPVFIATLFTTVKGLTIIFNISEPISLYQK